MHDFIFMGIAVFLLFIILILSWIQMGNLSNNDTTVAIKSAKTSNVWILTLSIIGCVGLAMYAAYYMYTSRKKILATAGKVIKKAGEYVNKKAL